MTASWPLPALECVLHHTLTAESHLGVALASKALILEQVLSTEITEESSRFYLSITRKILLRSPRGIVLLNAFSKESPMFNQLQFSDSTQLLEAMADLAPLVFRLRQEAQLELGVMSQFFTL